MPKLNQTLCHPKSSSCALLAYVAGNRNLAREMRRNVAHPNQGYVVVRTDFGCDGSIEDQRLFMLDMQAFTIDFISAALSF